MYMKSLFFMIDTSFLCSSLVNSYFWISVQSLLYFFVPSILIYRYCMSGNKYSMGINVVCEWPKLVIYTVLLIVSIPFVSFISQITRDILSLSFFSDLNSEVFLKDELLKKTYDKFLLDATLLQYMANIVVIGIIPAVSEEFFFRGIIQNVLCKHIKNGTVAVLFAAIIFSLAHFQISEFVSRTILGFIIGYAYLYSGSIWIPVLMHAVNNIIAVILYPLKDLDSFITEWWVVLLSVILQIALILYIRNKGGR